MLNLIITCDDPTERLLYGEPDPWLAQFECRHDVGYQHHHNVVNPPTGPGGPQPPDPPDPPDPPTSTPSTPRPPPPPPPPPEPSPADVDDWRDRQQTGEPSQSLAESVWRGQQAGREAEERGSDNPAVDRVQQSGAERAQRQEEIDRARFDPTSEYDVEEGLRQLRDLTTRAPQDPDAEWHDQLLELHETYADAWEAAGQLDMSGHRRGGQHYHPGGVSERTAVPAGRVAERAADPGHHRRHPVHPGRRRRCGIAGTGRRPGHRRPPHHG